MRLNEREILGGTAMAGKSDTPIILQERDNKIVVTKGCSTFVKFEISAASARVMARNLQRLARRIEARTASAMSAGTAETPQEAQGEARQRDGDSRDAQTQPPSPRSAASVQQTAAKNHGE